MPHTLADPHLLLTCKRSIGACTSGLQCVWYPGLFFQFRWARAVLKSHAGLECCSQQKGVVTPGSWAQCLARTKVLYITVFALVLGFSGLWVAWASSLSTSSLCYSSIYLFFLELFWKWALVLTFLPGGKENILQWAHIPGCEDTVIWQLGSYSVLSETFLWGDQLHGAPMGTRRCFLSYYRIGQQIFHPALPLEGCTGAVPQGTGRCCGTTAASRTLGWRTEARVCHRTKCSQFGQEHRCSPGVLVTQPGSGRSSARVELEFTQNLEGGYRSCYVL